MLSLDTNIFVYSVDSASAVKQALARKIAQEARAKGACIGLQVCGEFYAVASRKMGRSSWEAAQAARNLMQAFSTFEANRASLESALSEAAAGRFSYWDALLLASAEQAGCTYMISEDMADGSRLGSIQVVHPFAGQSLSRRTEAVLAGEVPPEP